MDKARGATQAWLRKYGYPSGSLFMRKTGDNREASAVKKGLLQKIGGVTLIVDDDLSVREVAKKLGISYIHSSPSFWERLDIHL